jgi:FkbM family methyltransferase
MAMISYAQNGEDIVIARALGLSPSGVYIDVGAGSPTDDSVTRHFYEHGWRGINVEPLPSQLSALRAERPEDVNLGVAAGASVGRAVLYDFGEQWGWSTVSPEVAARHQRDGLPHTMREVEMTTLAAICTEHVRGDIDFLKIDVEGRELDVLSGADFARWRPRLVVVEATVPGTGEPSHEPWEHILLDASYVVAWFDGVNRFYVAGESRQLIPRLAVPPNWFDHAESFHQHRMRAHIAALEDHVHNQARALEAHAARVEQLLAYIEHLETEVRAKDRHIEEVRVYVEHLLAEIRDRDVALAASRAVQGGG